MNTFETPTLTRPREHLHPDMRPIVSSPNETRAESPTADERARKICESGGYDESLSRLKAEGLLDGQIGRMRLEYRDILERADFVDDRALEMAAVLELYDPATWRHSIRVFEIAADKVESNLLIGHFLRDKLSAEGTSLRDLFLACLFHDVGKVDIPKDVLVDATTDEEWRRIAFDRLDPVVYSEITAKMRENPMLRFVDFIPYSAKATPEQLEGLRRRGIDPDLPLKAIIEPHAASSAEILRSYGYEVAAEIAGHHHDRTLADEGRPMGLSSFRASWILRAADIFEALSSRRSYNAASSSVDRALEVLEDEARHGYIDAELITLWANHERRSSPQARTHH